MPVYKAPLRDMKFTLNEMIGLDHFQKLQGGDDITPDLVDALITEAARFCENVLFPINQTGDSEGCHFENHTVRTPKGFKEAYQGFVDAGWGAIALDAEYGGQGLPHTLNLLCEEMVCSTNLAFGLYPGLTRGATILLAEHGSEALKNIYLKKMITGVWSGTMCLTEPHCGTDLGILRTKATPQEDGSYKISGTKIFISSGEHDLTENIIHFVIARPTGAVQGVKGISLFIVPKFMVKDDGTIGERNPVFCASIEHKMGIKGSSTCVLNFEEATGYLVGNLGEGLNNMFTMMNIERLGVGTQGLGISEVAYQNALQYARDRQQGRSLRGAVHLDKPADPIIVHPDVRRMLMNVKTYNEGCRMLAYWISSELDAAHRSTDVERRLEAEDLVALMTPIIKAFLTDIGFENTNTAMQVFGGHGYVHDYGMEQYVRDARIAQIYEGTNGIQALDLMGRKIPAHMGRYLRRFFHPILAYIEKNRETEVLKDYLPLLEKAIGRLQQATVSVAQRGMADPFEIGAASMDYLHLFAHTALAYLWCRAVVTAHQNKTEAEAEFYQSKLDTAHYFFTKLLTKTSSLFANIMAGGKPLDIKESHFGPF